MISSPDSCFRRFHLLSPVLIEPFSVCLCSVDEPKRVYIRGETNQNSQELNVSDRAVQCFVSLSAAARVDSSIFSRMNDAHVYLKSCCACVALQKEFPNHATCGAAANARCSAVTVHHVSVRRARVHHVRKNQDYVLRSDDDVARAYVAR
jgi:hypothetical protein